MLPNNQWVNKMIREEIKRYFGTNENRNIMTQNLLETSKTVLEEKFIAIQVYLMKQEKSQVNSITLEKEQTKLKVSGRNKIIKFRAEISKIETKRK